MIITAITLTYGRVSHLNECISGFLAQDYPDKRMIVLNSCAQQTLVGDFPNVRIINLPERPHSLAACRNIAVREAEPGIICVLDDDDIALPNYLSTISKHFGDGDWMWMDKVFYLEKDKIKSIAQGTANVFTFTREAWEKIGGYNEAFSVGEDRNFVSRMTAVLPGKKATLEDSEITYLYRWGQGAIDHISGRGDDRAGRTPAWERSGKILDQKIKARAIPSGRIELKPMARHDYGEMTKAFIGPPKPKNSLGVVLLGKFGDCINALPILKRLHDTGAKPVVIVSRMFASIFEGTSYVTTHPVPLQFADLLPAMRLAKSKFGKVLSLQVCGKGYKQNRVTSSYNEEPWAAAGMLDDFYNSGLKPVFDRRDAAREAALVNKLFLTAKPKIVTNLLYSESSPFPLGYKVLEEIKSAFKTSHEILDVSKLRLHRIYDLLAIIEKAELFVSIDTAALHLAAATDTPVLAIVNDKPWLGTEVRYNDVAVLPYNEATPARVVEALHAAIAAGVK